MLAATSGNRSDPLKTTGLLLSLIIPWAHLGHVQAANQDRIYERVTITDRLLRPWDMDFPDEYTALVTEKEGGLQEVNLKTGEKIPIAGLPDDLDQRNRTGIGDNSGLFAVKIDPDFKTNRWVYLSYSAKDPEDPSTNPSTTTKIVRGKLIGDELTSIETLFVAQPFSQDRYHYGGGMVFGGDGTLYFTVGERLFSEADQPAMPIAQNYQDRRGKIYRIHSDGSIPSDNPTFSADAPAGLFAVGIRAAQGLTMNPVNHEIWFSEHGTQQGDELNRLMPGANYGWPIHTTGKYRAAGYQPPGLNERTFTAPVWFWQQTVAPTGLTFYSGDEFPHWQGDLLVGGLARGSLWRIEIDNGSVTGMEQLFIDEPIRLRTVKQSPDGAIFMLTDEANGRILRLRQKPTGQEQ